ncbi:uncharacterized protein [Scyliorhinus torazame]|uniref:uncharacterized protein isoform X2 n=1 Tax=Scyliorhinus torazame TaxID=75743 RepID=UPI003B5B198B
MFCSLYRTVFLHFCVRFLILSHLCIRLPIVSYRMDTSIFLTVLCPLWNVYLYLSLLFVWSVLRSCACRVWVLPDGQVTGDAGQVLVRVCDPPCFALRMRHGDPQLSRVSLARRPPTLTSMTSLSSGSKTTSSALCSGKVRGHAARPAEFSQHFVFMFQICSIHSVLLLEQDSVDQAEGPTFGGKAGEQKDALTQCMLITQTMEYMDNGNTNPVTLLFLHRESGSQPCACSEGKNKKKSENVQKSRSGDHEEEHHTKGDISRSRTREGDGQKVPNQEEGPKLGCATTTGPRTSLHLVPTDPLAANHS